MAVNYGCLLREGGPSSGSKLQGDSVTQHPNWNSFNLGVGGGVTSFLMITLEQKHKQEVWLLYYHQMKAKTRGRDGPRPSVRHRKGDGP